MCQFFSTSISFSCFLWFMCVLTAKHCRRRLPSLSFVYSVNFQFLNQTKEYTLKNNKELKHTHLSCTTWLLSFHVIYAIFCLTHYRLPFDTVHLLNRIAISFLSMYFSSFFHKIINNNKKRSRCIISFVSVRRYVSDFRGNSLCE